MLTHNSITCCKCKIKKDKSCFSRDITQATGYSYTCKQCRTEYEKIWREKNIEKVRAKDKRRIKKPIPREKNAIRRNKRRERKILAIDTPLSATEICEIYNKFDNKCYKCNSTNRLSIDHHYPLSRGNPLSIGNAVLLCASCNSRKGNKLPENFYSPLELLILHVAYNIKCEDENLQRHADCKICGNPVVIYRNKKHYFCSRSCELQYRAAQSRAWKLQHPGCYTEKEKRYRSERYKIKLYNEIIKRGTASGIYDKTFWGLIEYLKNSPKKNIYSAENIIYKTLSEGI